MVCALAYTLLALTLALVPNVALTLNTTCLDGNSGDASLRFDMYLISCPPAEEIIFSIVENAVMNDPRMAASLLRLHFHDCFVNVGNSGCDASVLLDDTAAFVGEKTAPPNANSLRGFDVIDDIKSEVERACPATVSCADILAVAARDSVVMLGGPRWDVEMGRLDSRTASRAAAIENIPAPNSDVPTLTSKFRNLGLSDRDMVSLSGGHTIGKARCATFSSRLGTSSAGADTAFLTSLQRLCSDGNSTTLAHLDLSTPATFDNQYYLNLLSGQGLLSSDQALVATGGEAVRGLVETYAADTAAFFEDFKASMLNMGRLRPDGRRMDGEVRRNCRLVN